MPEATGKGPSTKGATQKIEERLSEAGKRVEEELHRLVRYIDDEVVPEVRRNSSLGLRSAATRLQELAQRLDDSRRPNSPPSDRGKQ